MSDARKFLKEDSQSKSPEDRLTSLEAKLPVLIERIQAYDQIIDTFATLEKTIRLFEKSILDINNIISSMSGCITMLIKKDDEIVSNASHEMNSIKKQVASIADKQADLTDLLERDIQEKQMGLSKLNSDIVQVASLAVSKSDFISMTNSLNVDVKMLKEEFTSRSNQIKDLNNALKAHSEVSKTLQYDISIVDTKVSAIDADFSAFPKELKDLDTRVTYDVNQRFMIFFEKVNARLDAISTKLIPQGASLKEIKTDFEARLEAFRLDVSNSILKSGNNSQQINLLEKKLENLRLLMNKHFIESNVSIATLDEDNSK